MKLFKPGGNRAHNSEAHIPLRVLEDHLGSRQLIFSLRQVSHSAMEVTEDVIEVTENGTWENSNTGQEPLPLYGIWFPKYDIPLIVAYIGIILVGTGNIAVVTCITKSKFFKSPINVIVVGLALSDAVATTLVAPLDLYRIVRLFRPPSVSFCTVKIILQTFVFTASVVFIFTFSLLRLVIGIRSVPTKLTWRQAGLITLLVYLFAAVSAPIPSLRSSNTFHVCMSFSLLPQAGGDTSMDTGTSAPLTYVLTTDAALYDEDMVSDLPLTAFTREAENSEGNRRLSAGSVPLWQLYMGVTFTLFVGTVTCYAILAAVLYKRRRSLNLPPQYTNNKRDILTLRVAGTVTAVFILSFLTPFIPALTRAPSRDAALHYVALFQCIASVQSVMNPVIYLCANKVYRSTLFGLLPRFCQCRGASVASEIGTTGNITNLNPLSKIRTVSDRTPAVEPNQHSSNVVRPLNVLLPRGAIESATHGIVAREAVPSGHSLTSLEGPI